MHQIIMGKPLNDCVVDHIDGNGLNNQRDNLRVVSRRLNCSNRSDKREGRTSSKYVGVYYVKCDDIWRATAQINNKIYCIGSYATELEAAIARDKKLLELIGDEAYLNFPAKIYPPIPETC